MRIISLIFLLLITSNVFANCVIDGSTGDVSCVDKNVSYLIPSQITLDKMKIAADKEMEELNKNKDLSMLIDENAKSIAIEDLKTKGLLTEQQATDEKNKLKTLKEAQTSADASPVDINP